MLYLHMGQTIHSHRIPGLIILMIIRKIYQNIGLHAESISLLIVNIYLFFLIGLQSL